MGWVARALGVGLIALACGGHSGHEIGASRPSPVSAQYGSPQSADEHVRLTLLEGHYEIVGAARDGDSIKFYPTHAAYWNTLGRRARIRTNRRGGAQLRLEGIDALETHYAPGRGGLGVTHQPLDLARAGASGLLDWLGFMSVDRNARDTVIAAQPARVRGYILARGGDRYGRCVAFAFRGEHPARSGHRLRVGPALLQHSLDYALLERGLVYPTYYAPLRPASHQTLTRAVHAAQRARLGVWARDRSTAGFQVGTLQDVQREAYIVSKLYRRLMDVRRGAAGV